MLVAKDYRRIARESLRGRWPVAIGTGFVAGLLGASISAGMPSFGGSSSSTVSQGTAEYEEIEQGVIQFVESDLFARILPFLIGMLVVILVWALVTLVIGGAVTLGYAHFNLNLVDGNNPRFSDLFFHIRRLWEGFCMQFFQGMLILLWSLLFVIPGIIASYRYAMTPYILAERDDLSVMEAISLSKKMMKGNKWELFYLDLTFIGWSILCIFTLGIGSLWLNPYIEASRAAFYREISEQRFSNPGVEAAWSESSMPE